MDASKVNLCGSRVLDYVSESDSDVEPATLETVWRDNDRDSSDAESVDSQQEDPLKLVYSYINLQILVLFYLSFFNVYVGFRTLLLTNSG